jgi:tetratricopeptide (TPR) repeat protein
MNSDPRLSDLLLRWEELCEQGQPTTVEELCRDCPQLLDELCRQVHALQAMNPLLRTPAVGPHEKETQFPGATAVAAGPDGDLSSPLWPAIPGYEIERELGRGGMGVVYLARQLRLNRRVALKMLLPESCGSAQQRQRFRTEAEIIAGLQHPHIVQIFEVGEVDGRAFCALELIEGGNLAEALAGQPCPPRVAAQLLATLADAVQAAHEKGVLHRDLKPANVLLCVPHPSPQPPPRSGEGEPDRRDPLMSPPGTAGSPLSASGRGAGGEGLLAAVPKLTDFGLAKQLTADQGLTQTGMVMGTPSYIAPEQVQGRNRELGPPADVYSLGAILYEALTGRPPLLGPTVLETFQLVLSHDPLPVRSLQPVVPRDLDTICLKCLHKDPSRRYGTARELGDDLRRFLAGEAVRARPTPSWERAYKWARRRPATAALVAMLVLALGGGIYLQRQHELRGLEQARHQREVRTAAENILKKVGELQAEQRWAEARVLLEQARDRWDDSVPAEFRARLEQALAEVLLVDELETVHLTVLRTTNGMLDNPDADKEYTGVFDRCRIGSLGDDPGTVAERIGVSAIKGQLLTVLDYWAFSTKDRPRQAWLMAVARRADPDPWRDRVRDPAVWNNRKKLDAVLAQARPERVSPQIAVVLGRFQDLQSTLPLLIAAQRSHPDDFWVNLMLGSRLHQEKRLAEAISYLRAAVALRPTSIPAFNNLGVALQSFGKVDEAAACWREALRLAPTDPSAQVNLAGLLHAEGKVDEAIASFRKVVELHPGYILALDNLALALKDKNLDEAIECWHRAVRLDPRFQRAYAGLGAALIMKRQTKAAIGYYRKAIELDPGDIHTHQNLADALWRVGKVDEAIASYRKVIELNPGHIVAHVALGAMLRDRKRDYDGAIACFRKAIEIDPRNIDAHVDLGAILCDRKRDYDGAIACFRKAIEIDPRNALIHTNLGNALRGKGRMTAAIASYRKAIELDPRYANAFYVLGDALASQGELNEAIACFRTAVTLDPRAPLTHNYLGVVLSRQGKEDEAIECFRKAVLLDPEFALGHFNLGAALYRKGKVDGAIECFHKAIKLNPRNADAYINLGAVLCDAKHDYDGAIACCRKALELAPRNAMIHLNLGCALKGKGLANEAITFFNKAIDLDPRCAPAHGALGEVLFDAGHYAEARDAWTRALGSLPEGAPMRAMHARQIEKCSKILMIGAQLPRLLSGEQQPSSAEESLFLATFCSQDKQMYAAAVRFYGLAFSLQPNLAGDLNVPHRYNAACWAALAGCGKGKDVASLTASDRLALRRRAFTWLRADLAVWQRILASARPEQTEQARRMLRLWQNDTDLAGLRDAAALAKLPAEDRIACRRLWADVAALLRKSMK